MVSPTKNTATSPNNSSGPTTPSSASTTSPSSGSQQATNTSSTSDGYYVQHEFFDVQPVAEAVKNAVESQYNDHDAKAGYDYVKELGRFAGAGTITSTVLNHSAKNIAMNEYVSEYKNVNAQLQSVNAQISDLIKQGDGAQSKLKDLNAEKRVLEQSRAKIISNSGIGISASQRFYSKSFQNQMDLRHNNIEANGRLNRIKIANGIRKGKFGSKTIGQNEADLLKQRSRMIKGEHYAEAANRAGGGIKNTAKAWTEKPYEDSDAASGIKMAKNALKVSKGVAKGAAMGAALASGAGIRVGGAVARGGVQVLKINNRLVLGKAGSKAQNKVLSDMQKKIKTGSKKKAAKAVEKGRGLDKKIKNKMRQKANEAIGKIGFVKAFRERMLKLRMSKTGSVFGAIGGIIAAPFKIVATVKRTLLIAAIIGGFVVILPSFLIIVIGGGFDPSPAQSVKEVLQPTIDDLYKRQKAYQENLTAYNSSSAYASYGIPSSWVLSDSKGTDFSSVATVVNKQVKGYNLLAYHAPTTYKSESPVDVYNKQNFVSQTDEETDESNAKHTELKNAMDDAKEAWDEAKNLWANNRNPRTKAASKKTCDEAEKAYNDAKSAYDNYSPTYKTETTEVVMSEKKFATVKGPGDFNGDLGTFNTINATSDATADDETEIHVNYIYTGSPTTRQYSDDKSTTYLNEETGQQLPYTVKQFYRNIFAVTSAVVGNDEDEGYDFYHLYAQTLFDKVMDSAIITISASSEFDPDKTVTWTYHDDIGNLDQYCKSLGNKTKVEVNVRFTNCGVPDLIKLDNFSTDEWVHSNGSKHFDETDPKSKDYDDWTGWTEDKPVAPGIHETVPSEAAEDAYDTAELEDEDWEEMADEPEDRIQFPSETSGSITPGEIDNYIEQIKSNQSISETQESLIRVAMRNVGACYYQWGGGHPVAPSYIHYGGIMDPINKAEAPIPAGLDCSGFVSLMLFNGGVDSIYNARTTATFQTEYKAGTKGGNTVESWKDVPVGTILVKGGPNGSNHVVIYAGIFQASGEATALPHFLESTTWGGKSGSMMTANYMRKALYSYARNPF